MNYTKNAIEAGFVDVIKMKKKIKEVSEVIGAGDVL